MHFPPPLGEGGVDCAYRAGRREAGTSEAANGPGIEDDVLGLEAQAVDGKLDHHVHGIGFILWEWHPLQKEGHRQEWVSTTGKLAPTPAQSEPFLQLLCNREGVKGQWRGWLSPETSVYRDPLHSLLLAPL